MPVDPNVGSGLSDTAVVWWDPFTWFNGISQGVSDWLGGLGGDIASGIEGGFIATIKDLWSPIEGVVLILIGGFILLWTLVFYFKEPIARTLGQIIGAAIK